MFGGRNIKYPINLQKLKPQKNRSQLTIMLERSECFNLSSELIFCPPNQYYFCNARRGCVIIPNKFQTSETCKRAQSWNPNYVNNNHLTPTSVKHEQPQKLSGFFLSLLRSACLRFGLPLSTVWWTPLVIISLFPPKIKQLISVIDGFTGSHQWQIGNNILADRRHLPKWPQNI